MALPERTKSHTRRTAALAFATSALIYYLSNPRPQYYYDYTFRVALSFLNGRLGLGEAPPRWLNEFVPAGGEFYSVFPLGSILTMMPFALGKRLGLYAEMPAAFIAALCGGVSAVFLYLIGRRYEIDESRRLLMIAGVLFGSFAWTNLTMAGAWQLALGFALAAELAAIYFTVFDRRPLAAGVFFAAAFGNRTEILLTAPIFLYFITREPEVNGDPKNTPETRVAASQLLSQNGVRRAALFCIVPLVFGLATLYYNFARFDSPFDFGYARIPGVLKEPWYKHGIFSLNYIPRQIWEMLLRPWELRQTFPYVVPNGFSSSVLLSSPFLLYAFRRGGRDRVLKLASWAAVGALCLLLWIHGNSGGWQFGYRYAIVLLPWLFVILLESAPRKVKRAETAIYVFSIAANAYATWLFHWTNYLKP